MKDLLKKSIAEFIGTFVLVFFACGVAAFTFGDIVATSLAFGFVIIAMAFSIGRVSGCHVNPAVSIACWLDKRMTGKECLFYIISQVLGGFIGAILMFGIAKMAGLEIYANIGDASNYVVGYAGELTAGNIIGALLTEIVLTCIFVFVILSVTDNNEAIGKKAGIVIGITLTLTHLIGINLTGTSVNPARSLATALGALIYTGEVEALSQVWIFIIAPIAGGILAVLLYKLFFKNSDSENSDN